MKRMRWVGALALAGFLGCGAGSVARAENETGMQSGQATVCIRLDGSGSQDADGDQLTYRWTQIDGPAVQLAEADTARPYFYTAQTGVYVFELVVYDGKAYSDPAQVNVVVERANQAPVAATPETVRSEIGQEVRIDGSGSFDRDRDELRYAWRQVNGPMLFLSARDLSEPVLRFTPDREGVYEFELVVNDGRDTSQPSRTRLDVKRPNARPVARVQAPATAMLSLPPEVGDRDTYATRPAATPAVHNRPPQVLSLDHQTIELGEVIRLEGQGEDPDGDRIQFRWRQTAGPKLFEGIRENSRLELLPAEPGTYIFELVASDGESESATSVCAVSVVQDDLMSMQGEGLDPQRTNVRIEMSAPKAPQQVPGGQAQERKGFLGRLFRRDSE